MGPPANADKPGRAKVLWQGPSRGVVVALVGPDGVGKTSQTAAITNALQKKFDCTAVYLGSGDGGWALRRRGKELLRKFSRRPRKEKSSPNAPARDRVNDRLRTALSGVAIAVERYWTLLRAMRMAASGEIVISDRWPQNMQPGMLDGPMRLDPRASGLVRLLSRFERFLYRRMAAHRPDLAVHMICDFETSNARKPGDRSRAEFEQRLALMDEMRRLDPAIMVVDAQNGFDEVTRELLRCVHVAKAHQQHFSAARANQFVVLFIILVTCLGIIEHGHA